MMKKNLQFTILNIISKEKDLSEFQSLNNEEDIYEICREYGYEETYEVFIEELNSMLKELTEEMEEAESKLNKVSGGSSKTSRKIASSMLSFLTVMGSGLPGAKAIDSSAITKKLSNASEKCKSWWKNASGKEKSTVLGLGGSAVLTLGAGLVVAASKSGVFNPKGHFLKELEIVRNQLSNCRFSFQNTENVLKIFQGAKNRLDKIIPELDKNIFKDKELSRINSMNDLEKFLNSVIERLNTLSKKHEIDTNFKEKLNKEIKNWESLRDKFGTKQRNYWDLQGKLRELGKCIDSIISVFDGNKEVDMPSLRDSTSLEQKKLSNDESVKKDLINIYDKLNRLMDKVENQTNYIQTLQANNSQGYVNWLLHEIGNKFGMAKDNKEILEDQKSGATQWRDKIKENKESFDRLKGKIESGADIDDIKKGIEGILAELKKREKSSKSHKDIWQYRDPQSN